MNITSKSRYALKIMLDLAQQEGPLVHRSEIAARQGIPLDYMDHILSRLRDHGLIGSTRGRSGGYRLAVPADRISVHEIFSAVEDAFQPVRCLEGGVHCGAEHVCGSKDAWGRISGAIHTALSGIILTDLVQQGKGMQTPALSMPATPTRETQECRAPERRAGGTRER